MRKFAALFVLVCALSFASFAQAGASSVSGGYAHLTGDPGQNGWYLNGAYAFTPMFAVEGDLGGYYAKEKGVGSNVHTFLFGPKLQSTRGQFRPWAHLLLGAGHLGGANRAGTTDFTWGVGVGGDLHLNEQWGARVYADLLRVAWYGSSDADTHARIGLGLVYHFGR